ncbi:phosphatase PAP2 family protein [Pseudaquabacterium pictum]|uniref:Phosphoesterase n=1 Tax=Pseudaquabacterium pictum TaxID=2315236 RepID=A0A480ART2_9BURK|nr:phosphatase PAP2 family protein [Rubrivivax pictus]GCL64264.1 phosphoesterase [Rubrivivax pictus]
MSEAALPGGVAWWWAQITRLGEAQILLPAMALSLLWLWRQPGGPRLALAWLLASGVAVAVTTTSKIAFLGFGIGHAPLDFTGFSGHAMFAAALMPLLLRLALGPRTADGRRRVLILGYLLALAVAVSRVKVGAHSVSEVVAGYGLGAAASALALRAGRWPALPLARWMPLALLAWALLGVVGAPASRTHDWVTRLSLALSGRPQAYQRWEMHRDHQQRLSPPAVSLPTR